jgi:hypothetical protein
MTLVRFAAAASLAALALAACGQKEDAQPGAVPPTTAAPPAAPLTAADWPQPSPGLWEMKVLVDGNEAGTMSRICYDAAFAKRMGVMGQQMNGEMGCQPTLNRQVDGSMAFTATCPGPDGKMATSRGVIRGDFNKAYSLEFSDADDPAGTPPSRMSATRLGDCPADYKPGDMEVAGVRMNLGSAMAGPDAPPSAPAP